MENSISEHVQTETARSRVRRIREEMQRGESQHYVSKEGRTGLHKIQKLLSEDLRALQSIDFEFLGPDRFYVEIVLERGLTDASRNN